MADATGVSTSMLFFGRTVLPEIKSGTPPEVALRTALADPKKNAIMPPTRGLTDFMVVWRQADRQPKWQDDTLVDGGGQWNGNIPIPMYRNMAAQLTLGLGKDTDLRVSAFAREFLDELPAPPYPFDVTMELAERGEKLYQQNCEPCHKPNNGAVYDMGTDTGRSFVVSGTMVAAAQENLSNICNEKTTLGAPVPETSRNPCAEFAGKPLGEATRAMVLRSRDSEPGYQARALSGVWAQAPYLHGGTVPTLFHLLVPQDRPPVFIKSSITYDPVNVGFEWRIDAANQSAARKPGEGVLFDTTLFAKAFQDSAGRPESTADLGKGRKGDPLSNRGHDRDFTDPTTGTTYTLNYDDRQEDAMAIIEYMKTL